MLEALLLHERKMLPALLLLSTGLEVSDSMIQKGQIKLPNPEGITTYRENN